MDFSAAEHELIQRDPRLGAVINLHGTIRRTPHHNYYESLVESIISQQLSVRASDTIFRRFKEATELDPAKALLLDEAACKTIGLSKQKAGYIRSLAENFVHDSAVFNHLESLSDDEVIAELTKIKGIGVWTAQMFLMFTLVRPDVFAPDDLGLLNAVTRLYELPARPTRTDAIALAERWAPYRTTASYHLWGLLDEPLTTAH